MGKKGLSEKEKKINEREKIEKTKKKMLRTEKLLSFFYWTVRHKCGEDAWQCSGLRTFSGSRVTHWEVREGIVFRRFQTIVTVRILRREERGVRSIYMSYE